MKYRGKLLLNPCKWCFRREQDPEATDNMCWLCYVASLQEEVL